jgi:hypothetical protein
LGLRQRGRSRVWIDDRGWWLISVEFQPSGWSKGSYLNVGATWLWKEQDYISFDYGSRVEGFSQFIDEAQFGPIASRLAERAADEVNRFRNLFPTVHAVARHLAEQSPKGFWDEFNAGVACGLSGDAVGARPFLNAVAGTNYGQDWAKAAAAVARNYCEELCNPQKFQRAIKDVVRRTRQLLRLPEIADITFDKA